MNDKIAPDHLRRTAIVYVRQSSPTQLRRNHESRRLQYAMKDHLVKRGWPAASVEVIDDDLGVTASGSAQRKGFNRMLAQVALGRIGIIAARELSRFARNDADWQRLFEICRQVNTILLDNETVYDVREANDRLLLGIKGNISGYELDLIRVRSLDILREMAQRGELIVRVPAGYIKTRDRRVEMTPDTRVREAISLVFAKFMELGSAARVVRWFDHAGLTLPTEVPSSRDGTQIRWVPPRLSRVVRFLRNPIYAGVYAHGRSRLERVATEDGVRERRIRSRDPEEWKYVIRDHHEGYVDFDTFGEIQRMLDNNRQQFAAVRGAGGAAKNGTGLLSGLIRCGYCGRLMHVAYSTQAKMVRYLCHSDVGEGHPPCRFRFTGAAPEALVVQGALEALEPLAVEAAERAFETERAAVDDRERALVRECDQARYEAERAQRQYDAIEPENRLVASTLESRWNEALIRASAAESRLTEHRQQRQRRKRGRSEFMALAARFPEIWNAPEADVSLKKRILRTLIEEIVADDLDDTREVRLRVHWKGGAHTEYRYRRRPGGHTNRVYSDDVVELIRALAVMCEDRLVAKYLNEHGVAHPEGVPWSGERVRLARRSRGIKMYDPERREAAGLFTLNEAAKFIGISHDALAAMARRGEVTHTHPLERGPYVFRRSDLEGQNGDRLRAIVRSRTKRNERKPMEKGVLFDELTLDG